MALTSEILKGNAATASLTDEQVSAIVEMSANDETTVIGQKTGEIYGGLDADILLASGISKNGTEKTYDYAKRVIGEIKAKVGDAASMQTQINALTRDKAHLEKVIAEGGSDEQIRKELTKAKADLSNVTKEYTTLKAKFDEQETEHQKALFDIKLNGELDKASASIRFKQDLPQAVTSVLMEQAKAKIKSYAPEYIDDGNGGKVLAFTENGTLMRNAENNLRPYTATELIQRELQAMGVLEVQHRQTGAGTPSASTGASVMSDAIADISAARTKNEAYELIAKQLMAQGMINGSKQFTEAMTKALQANREAYTKLPTN